MTVRWIVLAAPLDGRRLTVRCATCSQVFWPTPQELFCLSTCPHCVGWWTYRGDSSS